MKIKISENIYAVFHNLSAYGNYSKHNNSTDALQYIQNLW